MTILEQQEKIASHLKTEGFQVQYEVKGNSGVYYDMVAQRDNQFIVYEFKAQSQLKSNSPPISQLQQRARQDGYQDFRLVVVPEEKPKSIEIAGLNHSLLAWLQSSSQVASNSLLAGYEVRFQRVEMVQIDYLSSQAGQPGTDVSGVAAVEFVFASDAQREWDCPIRFDAHLDSNWQLESVRLLQLDLATISEDLEDYLGPKL